MNNKMDNRKSEFKKGIKSEKKTRQRQEEQINIRKAKRDEKLETKRRQVGDVAEDEYGIGNTNSSVKPFISREDERKERQSERSGDFKKGITIEDSFAKRAKDQIRRIKAKRASRLDKFRDKPLQFRQSHHQTPHQMLQKDIKEWKQMLYLPDNSEENVVQVLRAMKHFRSLTSSSGEENLETIINEIIELGIGPRVVELASASKFPKIQFEATWLLTNITSGTTSQTIYVANLPRAIEVLVNLLNSSDEGLRENVVWTLANMAGDSIKYRNNVLSINNVIPLFLKNLNTSTRQTNTKITVWALSNLLRGKPSPNIQYEHVIAIINSLAKLLNGLDPRSEGNKELISDLCWACSYISDDNRQEGNVHVPKYGDVLIKSGMIDKMIELLYATEFNIKQPSLRILGNLIAGTTDQTTYVLHHGFLVKCTALLNVTKPDIRKETVWILSNIAAGTNEQKNALFQSGLVEKVIKMMHTDILNVKNECLWLLAHLCEDEDNIEKVVDLDAVSALCDLLDVGTNEMLIRTLVLLKTILKYGQRNGKVYTELVYECVEKIEALQQHDKTEVYELAVDIIDKYFNEEDDQQVYSPTIPDWNNDVYNPSKFSF